MIVCHCHVVNDRVIRELIENDADSAREIGKLCGAGRNCGGCLETISSMIAQQQVVIAGP